MATVDEYKRDFSGCLKKIETINYAMVLIKRDVLVPGPPGTNCYLYKEGEVLYGKIMNGFFQAIGRRCQVTVDWITVLQEEYRML